MGQYLSTSVSWGFTVETSELPEGKGQFEDWEDRVALALGAGPDPSSGVADWGVWYSVPANKVAMTQWWDRRREAVAGLGVDVDFAGVTSWGDRLAVVHIKAAEQSGDEIVSPVNLKLPADDWQERLERFCEILGVPPQGGRLIAWSSYG